MTVCADAVEVFLDQLAVAEKQTRALDRRRVAPGGERGGRSLTAALHDSAPAQRHFGDDVAGEGIVNGRVSTPDISRHSPPMKTGQEESEGDGES